MHGFHIYFFLDTSIRGMISTVCIYHISYSYLFVVLPSHCNIDYLWRHGPVGPVAQWDKKATRTIVWWHNDQWMWVGGLPSSRNIYMCTLLVKGDVRLSTKIKDEALISVIAPVIEMLPPSGKLDLMVGDVASLWCIIKAGDPRPTIQWIKGVSLRPNRNLFCSQNVLSHSCWR